MMFSKHALAAGTVLAACAAGLGAMPLAPVIGNTPIAAADGPHEAVRVLAPVARAAAAGPWEAAPSGPTVRRAGLIIPDFAALDPVEADPRSVVRLALFDDFAPLVSVDRVERRHDTGYSWSGRVVSAEGGGGSFVLTVEGESVHGAVWLDDARAFEIRQEFDGRLWAVELDQAGFAPCATGPEHCVHAAHAAPGAPGAHAGGSRGGACPDNASSIDIMVVYTPAARAASGGVNGITALANSAVAAANNAYEASGIATRLELVYLGEVDYEESDSFSTDLSRLRNRTDGVMDEIHDIRDAVGADTVAMINNASGSCGVAYLMTNLSTGFRGSAFSVTRYSCAVGNLTFAHEVGHNMGSTHDRDNAGNSLFNYSFGHRWVGTNRQTYRSVMAYSPGSRVPRFSSPLVEFAGTPTGIAAGQSNAADNARSINESASTVANFTVSGDGVAPALLAEPADASVASGETAQFFAVVNAASSPDLRWFRDGAPVFDDGRITGAGTEVLSIADASPADEGGYQLYASNACGTVFSRVAALAVQDTACPADLAEPFGALNFFDVAAYLSLFNAGAAGADLAEPIGDINFFDLTAYLNAFNAGCP